MGRIPIITSQVSAKSGRPNGTTIDAYSTPDAFGAAKGRALTGLGQGLSDLAGGIKNYADKKSNEKAANAVAQSDFTRRELEVRQEVGPDGAGLQEKTLGAFDEYVQEVSNGIDDPIARKKYQIEMSKERNRVSSRSVTQEFTLDATYSKQQAEASLSSLENKIMADPSGYDDFIEQGKAVIDTRDAVPSTLREAMKTKWQQDSARARFVGMMEGAQTVQDLDAIASELVAVQKTDATGRDDYVGRDWSKEMSPVDYERTINQIGVARKAIMTKADADARAAIDTLEERAKDVNTLIPRDELKAVAGVVKQSQNPITAAKFSRIARDQEIIAEARALPAAEQRAQINAIKGSPGTAHPNVPERVSNAVNAAAAKFGVSAGYLATTAQKEYGEHFKRAPSNAKPEFKPVAVHGGVDLRNVRPDVADAATVAGELYGAPLNVTSGWRSQSKQDGIRGKGDPNRASVAKHSHHTGGGESDGSALDISTVGMSDADKARMVGALADAGFTGFGEYGTHIHADFRAAVPDSFGDRDGKTWGGWTYLSPGVADSLKRRGFASKKSAKELTRSAPVQYAEDIDYSKGTSITDADGKPTTGVVGVMQFASGTFLEIMKDPKIASRMGVDVSNMSDAQILKMREDPEVSIMAAAALGEKNTRSLEATLGRGVDDAEVYMAHFLGAGGAVAVLKGRETQPRQSAAALLPKAAEANRPIFYKEDGTARTVEELYGELSRRYVAAPSKVAFDDVQTRERVLANTEKQLKDNPMQFARESGSQDVPAFDIDNLAPYGAAVRSVADYYNLPIAEMNVLGPDELNSLKRAMDEGDADDTVAVLSAVQAMGSDVASAALRQLGEKDNVYAFAGNLGLATGQTSTAGDIARGQKRLNENPALKDEIGATQSEQSAAFRVATGNALNEVSPRARQDIQDAALAHYVETVLSRGKTSSFDQKLYENSVQAVMGGTREASSVGEVNGETTVLPPGVSADTMENAMNNMSIVDWSEQSKDGRPPRYQDGTLIDPADLADEAKLRAVGNGEYKIQLDDGTFAVTGDVSGAGRMVAYVFTPDPEAITKIASRSDVDISGGFEPADDTGLVPELNTLGNFDEAGRWVGRK